MNILITGSKGMLGHEILFQAQQLKHSVTEVGREELDITDIDAVKDFILSLKPDIVINCAAYTNVDACEDHDDIAMKVNAIGPRNLAIACELSGASLLHISTDYVFAGANPEPYSEFDTPNPQSAYGRSKYAAEQLIKSCCTRSYIVRTAWLYGIHGKNFVSTMLKLGASGKSLKVVNDQTGSPTYAPDLAEAILKLIEKPNYGTYHFTNSGYCTWYDFALEIFKQTNMDIEVTPCTTDEFPRPAKRPAYSKMLNRMGPIQGIPPLRSWKEGLSSYLRSRKNK